MPQHVLSHSAAEAITFLHRMPVVHAAVDAGVVYLPDHVLEALERVRGTGHGTGDGEGDLIVVEEGAERIHHSFGNAIVIGGIFRMFWRYGERYPVRICDGRRIAVG